jgi:large subunit ribosomal protein L9
MKVILNEDKKSLGKKGEIVNVSDGFAFNSLIPGGAASPATKEAMANLEKQKAQLEIELAEKKKALQQDAQKLDKKKITIISPAEGNKLFGSVDKKQIVEAIQEQHNIQVEESAVILETPLKELTTLEVVIDYGDGIKAGVILTIAAK